MIKRALMLLIVFGALTVIPALHAITSEQVIFHEIKRFAFQSG